MICGTDTVLICGGVSVRIADMPYHNRMCDLSMLDMQRIHLAHKRLEALYQAISATSMQGKAAMLLLINEADSELEHIFKKGVIGILNHTKRGKLPGGYNEPEFVQHVQNVIQGMSDVSE